MAARRVTAHDIAQIGDIASFIGLTIDQIRAGNMETKEYGVQVLRSLTEMQVGQPPAAKKEKDPLDDPMDLKLEGPDNITLIAKAYGIKALVTLLSGGSSVAQRDAAGALANIARGRKEYQERIIAIGGVKPLASMLRAGDASSQEQAAAALASVSQNLSQQKAIIESGAISPLVVLLKPNNVRCQTQTCSHRRSSQRHPLLTHICLVGRLRCVRVAAA